MHVLVAAGAAPPFFVEIALLIVAGALIGYLCQRLGLVPIVGFLVAGVIIGPHALGLVADREMADAAAELGGVLLLFTIGIEFSMEKLARIRRLIFLGGGLQVGLATAVTFAVCTCLGAGWRAALFTGLLVSLSSTVIVLKLLADRGETAEGHGRAGAVTKGAVRSRGVGTLFESPSEARVWHVMDGGRTPEPHPERSES